MLTQNEQTESGITYDDHTGISYQFPPAYRRIIQPGERFVYYKGRKTKAGRRAPQVYFGTGVIGDVRIDPTNPARLICDILDHRAFATPLPFKDVSGSYYESGANRKGYFQRGVRTISETDLDSILHAASTITATTAGTGDGDAVGERSLSYASPGNIRAIDELTMRIAMEVVQRKYPTARIERQPRNNPGFDILVREHSDALLYIEVKGTTRSSPHFFITEGELRFSRRHATQFRLLVIYALDMTTRAHTVLWHNGAILSPMFDLKPVQWAAHVSSTMV